MLVQVNIIYSRLFLKGTKNEGQTICTMIRRQGTKDRHYVQWSEDKERRKTICTMAIFYEYQQFFQHRICFSIPLPDYSDPWPTLARSTSFFLIMLFNDMKKADFGTKFCIYHENAVKIYIRNTIFFINLYHSLYKP